MLKKIETKRTFLILAVFISLTLTFPLWDDFIISYFDLNGDDPRVSDLKFRILQNLGYIFGGILLVIQIYISNRRAEASEKTAEAHLKSNADTRYSSALKNLSNEENHLARLGSLYQLCHIAEQNYKEYGAVVLDLLFERFHILCSKSRKIISTRARVEKKEKQLIIDKIFRKESFERIFRNEHHKTDLRKLNLEGLDFTDSYLANADFTETIWKETLFTNADLSKATLPVKIRPYDNLSGATLDEAHIVTGSDFEGAIFKNASLRNVKIFSGNLTSTDLSGADITNSTFLNTIFKYANFSGTIGLKYNQLEDVKSLYDVKNLDSELKVKLKKNRHDLFSKE